MQGPQIPPKNGGTQKKKSQPPPKINLGASWTPPNGVLEGSRLPQNNFGGVKGHPNPQNRELSSAENPKISPKSRRRCQGLSKMRISGVPEPPNPPKLGAQRGGHPKIIGGRQNLPRPPRIEAGGGSEIPQNHFRGVRKSSAPQKGDLGTGWGGTGILGGPWDLLGGLSHF